MVARVCQGETSWTKASETEALNLRMDRVRSLSINISDLKAHFSSLELSEALSFGEANKAWKFWMCCRCNEKFADAGSFMHHVVREHVGSLLPEMESVLPQNVENEWAEMILNCSWKPLELNAAVRILEKQSKSLAPDLLDDSKECFAGQEKSGGRNCSKESLLHKNWPLSDDPERAKLLARIRASFEALIKHKFLAASHLSKVIHFAVEELQGLACGSQLLNYNVDQTHLCICFLGATGLQKILNFVQRISQFCGLSTYSDQSNIATDDSNTGVQGVDITENIENIILSQDASYLLLDGHDSNSTAGTSSATGDLLASWTHATEEKAQQGLGILQALENEYHHVQGMCESKCEHLSYEEALRAVENFCLEKGKKREHATDSVVLCYETLLRKRREELIKSDSEINIIRNRFELDAIRNVLLDFQEAYSAVTSHLEDDDWRIKESCVEVAIWRQKEKVSIEMSKIDGRLIRAVTRMKQFKSKLEAASSYDFRSLVIPLVKSYLREQDRSEQDVIIEIRSPEIIEEPETEVTGSLKKDRYNGILNSIAKGGLLSIISSIGLVAGDFGERIDDKEQLCYKEFSSAMLVFSLCFHGDKIKSFE